MGGGSRSGSGGIRISYSRNAGQGSSNSIINYYRKNEQDNEKKKVFISFSMRDRAQIELLRQQAENERYDLEFQDNSLQQPVVGRDWHTPVGTKIENSDVMIVMVGEDTYQRNAVSWEIQQAYENDIPVIPIRVHSDQNDRLPGPIRREGDKAIDWKLDQIQYELDRVARDG